MKGVVCASCPPTGLSERLKGSSLEGGKGRCRGWSQSPHQPLKADQQQQQHHCTLPQEGTQEEIMMCTWLKLSICGNKGGIFKRKMTAAAPKLTSYAESVAWIMDEDFLPYWFLVLPLWVVLFCQPVLVGLIRELNLSDVLHRCIYLERRCLGQNTSVLVPTPWICCHVLVPIMQ